MDSSLRQATYPVSAKKGAGLILFILLWSWICFSESHTDNEVSHRMALMGVIVFLVLATGLAFQFLLGMHDLTLTPEGLMWGRKPKVRLLPWTDIQDFHVGLDFGPVETVAFIRSDTGAEGVFLNLTDAPAKVLCPELARWKDSYAGTRAGKQDV